VCQSVDPGELGQLPADLVCGSDAATDGRDLQLLVGKPQTGSHGRIERADVGSTTETVENVESGTNERVTSRSSLFTAHRARLNARSNYRSTKKRDSLNTRC
jgi:hypothetical protein